MSADRDSVERLLKRLGPCAEENCPSMSCKTARLLVALLARCEAAEAKVAPPARETPCLCCEVQPCGDGCRCKFLNSQEPTDAT